jgi:hypothetical protein
MASSQRILFVRSDDATSGRLAARQRAVMVIRPYAARQANLMIL